jgi:hypothetical protein
MVSVGEPMHLALQPPHTRTMEIQLRDYRIRPGHMDDWIAGWERVLEESPV